MFCATRTAFRITIRILKRYLLILKTSYIWRQIIFFSFSFFWFWWDVRMTKTFRISRPPQRIPMKEYTIWSVSRKKPKISRMETWLSTSRLPTGTLSNGKPSTGDYPGLPYSLWKKGWRRVNTSYYIWNIPSNRIARTLTGGMGSSAWGATLPSVRMGSPPKPTVTSESACMGTVRRKIRTG